MQTIRNGGLELAILSVLFKDRELTADEQKRKDFLEALPADRIEFTVDKYDYFYDRKTGRFFRSLIGSYTIEEIPKKIIIQRSIKNASGGWVHLDIFGNAEFDLCEDRKNNFFFINGAPY